MKTREQIIAEINPQMAEGFEIEEEAITPDAIISETLDLDSISLVDLMSMVHTTYGIRMTPEELPQLQTFDDLYNYIESHQP